MDEADLLADQIAVLAAQGQLVAQGTPVALKSKLGEGYTVDVKFNGNKLVAEKGSSDLSSNLLLRIRALAPLTYTTSPSPNHVSYHLKAKDTNTVQQVLQLVENEQEMYDIASYSVLGTSIEDIFLGLMHDSEVDSNKQDEKLAVAEKAGSSSSTPIPTLAPSPPEVLQLTDGRRRSPLSQAFTIFHKRALIARRSWLTPALAVLIAVAGACIPIFFLKDARQTCTQVLRVTINVPLYLPFSPFGFIQMVATGGHVLASPPGIISSLGSSTNFLQITNIQDNATFVDTINQTYRNQSLGGVSVDLNSGNALVAWEASPPGIVGPVMLNLASNILYNHALNVSGRGVEAGGAVGLISANYQNFPGIAAGTLFALKWVAFFGAAMVSKILSLLHGCIFVRRLV